MYPLTTSAGQLTSHPMMVTVIPRSPMMSQKVRAVRTLLVRIFLVSGSTKSVMPCFSGSFPVAIVAQMVGDFCLGSSE